MEASRESALTPARHGPLLLVSKLEANFCFLTIWFLQDSSNDVRRLKIPKAGQRDAKVSFVCFFCFLLLVLLLFCARIFSRNSLFFFILQEYSIEHCVAFSTCFYETQINYFQGSTYAERRQIRCCYLSEVIKWWAEEIISRLSTKNDWPIFL